LITGVVLRRAIPSSGVDCWAIAIGCCYASLSASGFADFSLTGAALPDGVAIRMANGMEGFVAAYSRWTGRGRHRACRRAGGPGVRCRGLRDWAL